MSPFEAYRYFAAMKLHFTSDKYDVIASKGAVKAYEPAFEKRNDKYLFHKLANKFSLPRDLIQYYAANMAYGNMNVPYDQSYSDRLYIQWLKRKQSRTQVFKDELNIIRNYVEAKKLSYEDLFDIEENNPHLLILYLGGHISLETMVMIQECEDYLSSWDSMIIVWKDTIRAIRKVAPFVKFDREKIKVVYNQFKENVKS